MIVGDMPDSDAPSWTDALPCILQARELMETRGSRDTDTPPVKISGLAILGWTKSGSRRVRRCEFEDLLYTERV